MVRLHPDKFMQKSQEECTEKVRAKKKKAQSSVVNAGYNTLKHQHARAVYMLKALGVDFDESTSSDFGGNNMEFMMAVLEASSEIVCVCVYVCVCVCVCVCVVCVCSFIYICK
jgi:hypothetical protein